MLSDSVDVTFHDCTLPDRGPLMETTELCELSAPCSQDEFLGVEVTVVAPVGTLDACFAADEQISLRADVIDGDGNSKNPLATQWRAADPGIASISHSGVVTGRGAGVTEIGATYLQFGKEYADTHPISVIDLDGTWPGVRRATATKNGCAINGSATANEDAGIVTGSVRLDVSPGGRSMSGGGGWNWTGSGYG